MATGQQTKYRDVYCPPIFFTEHFIVENEPNEKSSVTNKAHLS